MHKTAEAWSYCIWQYLLTIGLTRRPLEQKPSSATIVKNNRGTSQGSKSGHHSLDSQCTLFSVDLIRWIHFSWAAVASIIWKGANWSVQGRCRWWIQRTTTAYSSPCLCQTGVHTGAFSSNRSPWSSDEETICKIRRHCRAEVGYEATTGASLELDDEIKIGWPEDSRCIDENSEQQQQRSQQWSSKIIILLDIN